MHLIKNNLSKEHVLAIFDQKYETELHTDACIDGYKAVLLQKSAQDGLRHPKHDMSKKISDAERQYTSYEVEVLAIIHGL